MRLAVTHTSIYRYPAPVRENTNEVRLLPREFPRQRLLGEEIRVEPYAPVFYSEDYWGNRVVHFNVHRPHMMLLIESRLRVETLPDPILPGIAFPASPTSHEFRDFLLPTQLTAPPPDLGSLGPEVTALRSSAGDLVGFLDGLAAGLRANLRYERGVTTVESSVADVIAAGGGVCQDFTHLFICICRMYGIPARYAGGYHYQGPGGTHENHAWAEVHLGELGWAGWDPANGIRVGERHVQTTAGRDYADVSPVRGSFRGPPDAELEVQLHMEEF